MGDFSWTSQSSLQKALVPGLYGEGGAPGVELTEIRNILLVQVMARRGKAAETAKVAKKLFAIEPPSRPGAVSGKGVTLIWSGPDQFLVFAPQGEGKLMERIVDAFAGIASLSDQSDGRCVLRISGQRSVQAMAKFLSIDFHDGVFLVGAAATTSLDHTAANIWRSPDAPGGAPVYHIAVFTSFADSLYRVIADSSLEYGLQAS
ncbi:sarcosine oxidase subunit gamma [Paracoccus denitrificans]|uniref:sarcosine oxidase subunit gamma n=1 Tax=Paracoccus denitrificans TaxID=266 RepID=UPI000CEC3C67|nr:sarcosine oxidase subunit gamma family protein [Paracoccus denitrificans]